MLAGRRVLIAEDELLIAESLAQAVEDAHGEVIGPISRVRDGLVLLTRDEVHAAILDVRLVDGDVFPLAKTLLDRGKVFVLHSASPAPEGIVATPGRVSFCPKPMGAALVVTHLAALIQAAGWAEAPDIAQAHFRADGGG
jgi:DNA-binding response OmpR family regulator